MKDENRTKDQLIKELKELHQQIRDLKNFEVEHKRTEKVLLQCEERYHILAENPMDGIYISTESGFEYVNPAFEEICGYKSEELCSRDFNFLDLIHPDDKELVKKRKEAREKGKILPSIYEFRIITKEEEIRYVEVNTVSLLGERGKILGILRDITERKISEEKLKKQNLRNKLILQTALNGFFLLDRKGTILEANKSVAEIVGYPLQKIFGMNIRDLEENENAQEVKKYVNNVMKKGFDRFETKLWNKNGKIVELRVSTSFIDLEGNKFFFTFFHDITKSKITEQALRKRGEKELETKSSNPEEFNTTLEVLLKKREEDKAELEKSILFNVEDLVVPYIEKLKKIGLSKKQGVYVGILENNLKEIISPFSRKLSTKYHKFTPAEIRVADLVRQGKRNKEIAEILNVSPRTAAFHRENIRKKLGIRKNKTNLTSYLSSLP